MNSIDVVTVAASPGETFWDALGTVRRNLLDRAKAADRPTPTSRDLRPGEVIYHRKVGDSKKYDHFDEGSVTPCMHGVTEFGPWSGDKAVKGMRRIYDNFTDPMLIHCSKFPKCGMYGVDAARGGHRIDTS